MFDGPPLRLSVTASQPQTPVAMLANLLLAVLITLPLSLALGPLLPTITYGDTRNAVFTVFSQTLIEAPVWQCRHRRFIL